MLINFQKGLRFTSHPDVALQIATWQKYQGLEVVLNHFVATNEVSR
jgi:hypothetical protein